MIRVICAGCGHTSLHCRERCLECDTLMSFPREMEPLGEGDAVLFAEFVRVLESAYSQTTVKLINLENGYGKGSAWWWWDRIRNSARLDQLRGEKEGLRRALAAAKKVLKTKGKILKREVA